jgi:hypothetical protein
MDGFLSCAIGELANKLLFIWVHFLEVVCVFLQFVYENKNAY